MLVFTWIVLLLLGYVLYRGFKWHKFFKTLEHIPGPKAYPFIGNALHIPREQHAFMKYFIAAAEKYGQIFRFWVGPRPFVFIQEAGLVQTILTSNKHIEKSIEYDFVKPWIGEGLITSSGDKWHARRKLLTPTFHYTILESYKDIIWNETQILKEKIGSFLNTEEFNLIPLLKLYSLDVICGTSLGCSLHAQENAHNPYVLAIEELNRIASFRFISPWLKPNFLFNLTSYAKTQAECVDIIHNFTNKVIATRKKEIGHINVDVGEKNFNRQDTLTLLLKLQLAEENISDNDILEEVNTIMFAGHDTSATTVSFCLFILGHHKDVQDRIIEELDQFVPDFMEQGLSINQLSKLNFLDACIKEAMRLFPIVPLIARELHSKLITEAGPIEPGSTLLINSYSLHRDPKYFPNPNEFIPNRFIDQSTKHPFSFIPFSGGLRNCIGQKLAMIEMKTALAVLLKTFIFHSKLKPEELVLASEIVLASRNGVPVGISKRF